MRKVLTLLLIFCFWLGYSCSIQAQHISQGNEFEALMQKYDRICANPDITQGLEKYNVQDGSFTDVDYASIQRTNWPPLVHINRISDFVLLIPIPKTDTIRMRICIIR